MGRRSRVDLGQPASVEVDFERGERVDGAEGIACPTWCEFMEDSLHHPEWGYYSAARVVFGDGFEHATHGHASVRCVQQHIQRGNRR